MENTNRQVCEDLITLISSNIKSANIRIWGPDERTLTDDEMCELFQVYNIFVYLTHSKKRGSKPSIEIKIGKDFYFEILGSRLDFNVEKALRAWARSSANLLYKHFLDESLYLGKLRFDLITEDKKFFIVPNIDWNENIYIYDDVVKSNSQRSLFSDDDKYRISLEKYTQSKISDDDAIAGFRAMASSVQKK